MQLEVWGRGISRYVRDTDGVGISGVTLNLTGDDSQSVVTDNSGYYSFAVSLEKNYPVTPSKSGWTFSPPLRSYSPLKITPSKNDYVFRPPLYYKEI